MRRCVRSAARALGLVVLATAAGCAQFRPPPGGGAGAAGPPPASACAQDALIEDAEDGDNQILVRGGRGGYLYTFKDGAGTVVEPAAQFATAAGGAETPGQALRFHGTVAKGQSVYAGLGLSFTDPKAPYDASRYRGIAFYARRAPGSTSAVRLKVPDVSTDPDGGVCSECFNDFGVDFQVGEAWTRYEVSFADLKQGSGWGQPRPPSIDPRRLYSVQWQVTTSGASFDIWIDDVSFIGCP
jgi:endoglucanase